MTSEIDLTFALVSSARTSDRSHTEAAQWQAQEAAVVVDVVAVVVDVVVVVATEAATEAATEEGEAVTRRKGWR